LFQLWINLANFQVIFLLELSVILLDLNISFFVFTIWQIA